MQRQVPLLTPGYKGRSVNISAQERINLFPQVDTDYKKIVSLIGTPGKILFSDICGQPTRGLWMTSLSYKMWTVMGNKFYEVLANGVFTFKGTLQTSQGLAHFADNGTHILIVDGSQFGYYYEIATGTFTQITDVDFVGGTNTQWIDGYFFVNDPATGKVRSCTAPYGTAPSDWNSLDVATAEGDPDNIVSVEKNKQLLILMGDYSTEIFYNAATAVGLPFLRMGGAVIDIGLAAKHSVCNLNERLYWVSKTKQGDRTIHRSVGTTGEKISDHAIEYQLGQMDTVSDAYSLSYTDEGHGFAIFTFPIGDKTFAFDDATGLWHQRSSDGAGRWKTIGHVFFNGWHIVGDSETGRLYKLDLDTFTDNGEIIKRILIWPHIKSPWNNKVFLNRLELDMELGVGITGSSDYGTDITSPGTAADDAAIGTVAFTDPDNAKAHDDARAAASLSTLTYADINTDALSPGTMADDATVGATAWSNPDNAKVGDDTYANLFLYLGPGDIKDTTVRIVKSDGSLGATNKATNIGLPGGVASYRPYGSSTDLWDETWTVADINDPDFGVAFSCGTTSSFSHYLKASNFGFAIPIGVTINGIIAEIKCFTEYTAENGYEARVYHIRMTVYYTELQAITAIKDTSVRIVKSDGSLGSTNKAVNVLLPVDDTYRGYGNATDLWNEVWTAADINDTDFGIAVSFTGDFVSHYLKVTNFGFAIPTDAIIKGIFAEIETRQQATLGDAEVNHIRMIVYYALPAATGVDPQVAFSLSTDGGYVYGNERICSIGQKGNRTGQIGWNNCGSGYDLTPRILISDPVKVVITGAYADIDEAEG